MKGSRPRPLPPRNLHRAVGWPLWHRMVIEAMGGHPTVMWLWREATHATADRFS
ncbi:MAG: hypothetical protein K2K98_09390 [Muribaculaceae bacterium]|nr:hypothetical protein [Muribaculaceae bacterium]